MAGLKAKKFNLNFSWTSFTISGRTFQFRVSGTRIKLEIILLNNTDSLGLKIHSLVSRMSNLFQNKKMANSKYLDPWNLERDPEEFANAVFEY
jgi:hypothetical protein